MVGVPVVSAKAAHLLTEMAQPKRRSITGVKRRPKKTQALQAVAPQRLSISPDSYQSDLSSVGHQEETTRRGLLSARDSIPSQRFNVAQMPGTPMPLRLSSSHLADKSGVPVRPRQMSTRPTLKHVAQKTIQAKWKVLDAEAQSHVEAIFQSTGMPILAEQRKEATRIEAQDSMTLVKRSLCKRLPKMPFPPSARAGQFDYNALTASNVSASLKNPFALRVADP